MVRQNSTVIPTDGYIHQHVLKDGSNYARYLQGYQIIYHGILKVQKDRKSKIQNGGLMTGVKATTRGHATTRHI